MARLRFVSLNRVLSSVLVMCLLSGSAPAAPKTIVAMVEYQRTSFAFWYQSSGLSKLVQGRGVPVPPPQERQANRDAKVARLEISPANITVDPAERVRFVTASYDTAGNAVGGVKVRWSAEGATPSQRARMSRDGEFHSIVPGVFTVTAQAAGRSKQTTVTVRAGQRPNLNAVPTGTRQVSSRDLPPRKTSSTMQQKNGERVSAKSNARQSKEELVRRAHGSKTTSTTAPEPMPQGGGGGWDSSNYWSADDPENRVGDPPGTTPDGGAGSGNFQFSAPIYSAAGRGIDISLALAYNSRVWNKAGTQMGFDNDRGWPSPGFNLGFGKLLGMTVNTGCMLVDANGTRHSYSGSITFYSWGTYGVMHTTDGSFIDYTYTTGTNGVITGAQAKLPNGTIVNYGAYSQAGGGVFPTSITDPNGNYIYITYVNNAGPRIQTVTDTLGRVINFHYDPNNLLTAVTAPGQNGGTRTLVRLHYRQLSLSYGFSWPEVQSTAVSNPVPWVLDAIYYPGTGTGYWFYDSYSSYGMLANVIEQRNMGFSGATLNDMGVVYQGWLTRQEEYNYPLTPNYSLTDAPTFTTMTERWTPDGSSPLSEAVTTYDVHENASPRTTTITFPNGTKTKQFSYNAPGSYLDGVVFEDRSFTTDENNPLQKSTSSWEQGAYNSPRPTRVEKFDERNQKTAVEFVYGPVYNQVVDLRDYDYGGTNLLRSTRITYQNSTNYTGTCYSWGCAGRHIFNLPLTVEVYAADDVTRVSRTEYQYDGQTLTDTPGVVNHSESFNPYAEPYEVCDCIEWDYWWINCVQWNCYWVSGYDSSTDYRGNVTQIISYADAINLTGAVTETRRYDKTGNMVMTSSSCCEQQTFAYTLDYQYAYAQSRTSGSATDPNLQIVTSAIYDFNTGLTRYATDANGRTTETVYDDGTLRVLRAVGPTGAHTDNDYNDSSMFLTQTTYLEAHPNHTTKADEKVRYLNGRGQVRQVKALGANSVWDFVDTVYNNMGQVSQQTLPYRSGETLQWTTTAYDAQGRATSVTAPDGSVTQTFYNEVNRPDVASSAPGETTRIQDAWGRERWGRADAAGRLVEVVEPIFWGNGSVSAGMATTYTYNTLGDLIQIDQGAQTRRFKHDSLRRLTAQKLAEMNATLNDAGVYVGSGTWSDVFTYDERSNVTSRTDARGVKTVYTYNNDPLNRLQSVSWDTSGFGDTANPILPAATVTYQYRNRALNNGCDPLHAFGRKDITQLAGASTAGISSEIFCQDSEGRTSSKTLTLTSRSGYAFQTDYNYDALDRIWRVWYPAEYGNGSNPRKAVEQSYDVASRISSLTFDSQTQASNISYNAASQTTSLAIGTGTNQVNENYGYHAQTGLLESQTITRNGATLLNLSYDYAGANSKRTGQLTKIYDNLAPGKNRSFEYDALGRLVRATGGQISNATWAQRYEYDRYGNRNNVYSFILEDYIRNFYQSALNRQPDTTEINYWLSTLRSSYSQGQSQFLAGMQNLGTTLFTSQEYIGRGRTDSEFVYDLYKAFLYREPDPDGYAYWVSMVPINGRNNIRLAFEWAPEFYTKVAGISPYPPPVAVPRDGLQGIAYNQATNRILNSEFTYDAAGNQVRALIPGSTTVSQRFQYDAANRLIHVKTDAGTVLSTYTYGDDNQRLIAEDSAQGTSTRTYYVAEGLHVIAEYSENGGSASPAWSRSYVYLGNRLLSTMTPNLSSPGSELTEYHHPDRLGTRIITNPSTGSWSEQANLPFGTALSAESSGTPSQRRFTSYERSGMTGLDYAVNRNYDAQQGRFSQVDPAGMKAVSLADPQTLNLYSYCTNDPTNRVDSDGLGLLSFFKKVFRWIKTHWKMIIVVAAMVAFAFIGGAGLAAVGSLSGLRGFAQEPGRVVFRTVMTLERFPGWVIAAVAGGIAAVALAALALGGTDASARTNNNSKDTNSNEDPDAPCTNNSDAVKSEMKDIAGKANGSLGRGLPHAGYQYGPQDLISPNGQSYNTIIDRLRNAFSNFRSSLNANAAHFGGDDYSLQLPSGRWYHLTVGRGYSEQFMFARGGPYLRQVFDPKKPPPWITIHCHGTTPDGWTHIWDFTLKKIGVR